MKRRIRSTLPSVCSVLSVVILLSGCAGDAPNQIGVAPDRARLVVALKAEPKKGWHDPKNDSAYTGLSQIGQAKQFETVDYDALEEIVVWIEPSVPTTAEVSNFTLDVSKPSAAVQVAPAGAVWFLKGGSAYMRTEDGRVMNLKSSSRPTVQGLVEVMVESRPEPVARIYVTPTRFAQVGQSGQKLTFDDLPPGPARIVCWHPRLPGMQTELDLPAGKATSATLTVGVNSLPKIP